IPSLYVSGEESAPQLAGRFSRLGLDASNVNFLEALPIETIVATIEKEKPALAIVDSVQTLSSSDLDSAAGTPAMVRYATSLLLELAKRTNIPVLLIGQVTKDGSIAGPKTLEHLVDVVVSLEGDPVHAYRILRAAKNRFGATDEVGVFEMTAGGMKAVENPSARFLEERRNVPGSVIAAAVEGSRVFLVEVQALVEKASYGTPTRRASGFDQNRLQMLCAILSKHAGLKLGESDVYVNVIGGLELREPAADLAVCAAIVSASRGTVAESPTVFVGEVGLGGEVRSVVQIERRASEAKRMGIDKTVGPKTIKTVKDL
ncbi:MAG: magnesium chelatase domain-containing protein, partial [Candidatus Uhrbacteria bacterium]